MQEFTASNVVMLQMPEKAAFLNGFAVFCNAISFYDEVCTVMHACIDVLHLRIYVCMCGMYVRFVRLHMMNYLRNLAKFKHISVITSMHTFLHAYINTCIHTCTHKFMHT